MSRTYRNKKTVPPGWEVRDDGVAYCNTCCPNQEAKREKNRWRPGGTLPRSLFWQQHKYCACYRGPVRFRRGLFRKEGTDERKEHHRAYRSKVKDRMRHEDWEGIPRYRRTSGWLTW